MPTQPPDAHPSTFRLSLRVRACTFLVLLQCACATGLPRVGSSAGAAAVVEPDAAVTRPVHIPRAEFQHALQRLASDVHLGAKTPRQAAHALLELMPAQPDTPRVAVTGYWKLEQHHGEVLTWEPERQDGPVALSPQAEEALKEKYLQWCVRQGGGDCLGLLDDGPFLRADDRRAFALALAFGSVLDETRDALQRELLSVRALFKRP